MLKNEALCYHQSADVRSKHSRTLCRHSSRLAGTGSVSEITGMDRVRPQCPPEQHCKFLTANDSARRPNRVLLLPLSLNLAASV